MQIANCQLLIELPSQFAVGNWQCAICNCLPPQRSALMPPKHRLTFEQDIYDLEDLLAKLEANVNGHISASDEVRRIRRELIGVKRKIYGNLTPWQTVEV